MPLKAPPLLCSRRFNRYMVECEYASFALVVTSVSVLIDTWWNVN